jgi:NADPH:quinone reductase-like Zn-dependent oxidoreductase
MPKMKAVQVPKAGADFEIVEREIPEPGAGQVRIRVQACGICHGDVITKEGFLPGITYPRVPGHEVAGVTRPELKAAWERVNMIAFIPTARPTGRSFGSSSKRRQVSSAVTVRMSTCETRFRTLFLNSSIPHKLALD